MSNTVSRVIITSAKSHKRLGKRHSKEAMTQLGLQETANLAPAPVKQRSIWVLIPTQILIKQPIHPGNCIYRFHTEKCSLESNFSLFFFSIVMLLPLVFLLAGSSCLQLQTNINSNFLGHQKCNGQSALHSSLIHKTTVLKHENCVKTCSLSLLFWFSLLFKHFISQTFHCINMEQSKA